MMEGFDDDWINAGNNHTARYTNLKAGEYIFKVKATNCDGVLNPNETSLKIIITPPFWETTWFRIIAIIAVIVIFYLILRLRFYKLKRDKRILEKKVVERTAEIVKQKEEILEKNKELEQQKEEILTQRDEIQIQRNVIERKNKNITASITYAQRIQQAILPDDEEIKSLLHESFVFYKPKDIVSGDFYWISDNNDPDDKIIYVAAVDCTGHGVPGAFMSIMGHSILKQAIFEQKLKQPAEIIHFISKEINILLRQKEKNKAVKDGMDIALLAFHPGNMKLEYAGVHNPLYLVTNNELVHYKADTFPIGEIFYSKIKAYTNNQVCIKKGDMLYIFSDGFVDQYGGIERKKYMSKRFKELLLSLHKLEISEQKKKLEAEFDSWKANYDQIDDVLIIGFKIV
jgi:serine phosphatase RsbU (regulator of sigma subunit)